MENSKQIEQEYLQRIKRIKKSLIIEVFLTICIAFSVVMVGVNNLGKQMSQYTAGITEDYYTTIDNYISTFKTMTILLKDKLAQNPSFEEMNSWLKSMDGIFLQAVGEDVYDGISMTYKGGYAYSWNYGDYSNYEPSSRIWYQQAQQANGEVAVVAPYVTYLAAGDFDNDEYFLMSLVQKYNDEISFDYDLKIMEIEKLLTDRKLIYANTQMLLYDKGGYVLSSNNESLFTHNVNTVDGAISSSLSEKLNKAKQQKKLMLTNVDHKMMFVYSSTDKYGLTFCKMIPFTTVFVQDFMMILIVALCSIIFEIYLYRRNMQSLLEFKRRDERLSCICRAAYQHRVYVDLEKMSFYGNDWAKQICPNHQYSDLYEVMKARLSDENELQKFTAFVSPMALKEANKEMYHMVSKKFAMSWPDTDGKDKPSVIEVSRLASIIDGRQVVGILCNDVSESVAILKDALKQAKSASQAKGDFMSRMSHEIRTPLNAVLGYLDIARDEKDNLNKVEHCLEQSTVAAKHLLNIINDVLDISSIESGRLKLADEDFDLTQLVHSLTAIFYSQAKEKNVAFDVEIDDLSEEWVSGDSLRVNQILLNLLSNAIKFTPAGGAVKLIIKQIGQINEKIHFQFQIVDTGIGMSKEYLSRIFQPFEQESAATAKNYGGTGLGLSISYNLVQLMGGKIEVTSEVNQGTTFSVNLAFNQAKQQRINHLTTTTFSKLRALVVDDEESSCQYIQKLLERCGVKCDTLTSGKKAIRRVKNRLTSDYPYDLCIVDWNMKELDGLETAKQIRQICGKGVPIIIATAYDYSAIIDDAKAAGVDKIVSKPLFQSTMFDLLVNTYGKYKPVKTKEKEKMDFQGIKVLLAEDNEMNMEIAVDILTKAGMKITPVVNGKEAVDTFLAAKPGTYDAILMDIQMPVMDGYEATKMIRQSSHDEAKSIPIVAMTANAFTADVTAALVAGMNDHIAKPISYEHLFEVLMTLIKDKGVS